MRVLIVDDSRSMRMILKKTLRQLDISDVDEAGHGAEALERIASGAPDVALIDWNMPVMGGKELIEQVRGRRDYDGIKLMVVTSESNPRVVYEALKAGADEYAMKPITPEIVSEKLELMGLELTGSPL